MDILKHVLNLAGVSEEEAGKVLANEAFKGVEIPDDITARVKNSLLNMERAKSHPDIKNHFKGEHFGMVDKALQESLKSQGFADEEIKAVFDDRKTNERVQEALSRLAEKAGKKSSASTNEQIEELRVMLKQREEALSSTKQEYEGKLTQQSNAFAELRYNQALSNAISSSGLKFKDLPSDLLQVNANYLISTKLSEIGAVARVNDAGKIALYRKDDESQEFYNGAEKASFYDLLPSVLDSITEKKNGGSTGSGVLPASTAPAKNRVDAARMRNLKSIGQ